MRALWLVLLLTGCGMTLAAEPADAPLERGDRALAAGRFETALAAYAEASTPIPSGRSLSGMGRASLRLGRAGAARGYLERAVALDPANAWAWNDLGVARLALGDRPGARTALRTAFALDNGQSAAIWKNLTQVMDNYNATNTSIR